MQNRLKCRVWDKKEKSMLEVRLISWFNTGKISSIRAENVCGDIIIFDEYDNKINDAVLIQCTGQEDKNSQLIYEGDIVHKKGDKDYKNEKLNSVVIHSQNGCSYYLSNENGLHRIPANSQNLEVLGNIFEDFELQKTYKNIKDYLND